jgi:hypothetical protein
MTTWSRPPTTLFDPLHHPLIADANLQKASWLNRAGFAPGRWPNPGWVVSGNARIGQLVHVLGVLIPGSRPCHVPSTPCKSLYILQFSAALNQPPPINEGGVVGFLAYELVIFRRVPRKYKTTFVKQNGKLFHKCGFRFQGRASEQAQQKKRVE